MPVSLFVYFKDTAAKRKSKYGFAPSTMVRYFFVSFPEPKDVFRFFSSTLFQLTSVSFTVSGYQKLYNILTNKSFRQFLINIHEMCLKD